MMQTITTTAEIHPSFQEGLALYEAFRRLGFSPEEIHAGDIGGSMFAIAVVQDGVPYAIEAGPIGRGWRVRWGEAAEWWNRETTSDDERSVIWSEARIQAPGTWAREIASLVSQGLRVPGRGEEATPEASIG